MQMLKHGAVTQIEDADSETRSCHTVQNCNAETQKETANDVETQKETANDAETQAVTVSGQGRHSQERNSRG